MLKRGIINQSISSKNSTRYVGEYYVPTLKKFDVIVCLFFEYFTLFIIFVLHFALGVILLQFAVCFRKYCRWLIFCTEVGDSAPKCYFL